MVLLSAILLLSFLPSYFQQNIRYVDLPSTNQPSYFSSIYDANINLGSSVGKIMVISSVESVSLQEKIEILNNVELSVFGEIKVNINFLESGQVLVKENAILNIKYFQFIFDEVEYEFDSAFIVAKNGQIIFQVIFFLCLFSNKQNN